MKTKVLNIDNYWDSPATVVIKKMSFGDASDIRDTIQASMVGTVQQAKISAGNLGLLTLMKGIYTAPFVKINGAPTMAEVRTIDGDLGDFLLEEINQLNDSSPNLKEASKVP